MLNGMLQPFVGPDSASPRLKRFWIVLLLGAPLALALGIYLQNFENARRRIRLQITRADAVRLAEAKARDLNLRMASPEALVSFDYDEELSRYLSSRFMRRGRKQGGPPKKDMPGKGPPRASQDQPSGGPLIVPGEVRVLLSEHSTGRWLRVRLTPSGRLVGWRVGGIKPKEAEEVLPPEEALKLAEQSFAQWLGEEQAERIGAPEMERFEEGGSGYRFTWRARNPRLPDLEYVATGEVEDRMVRRMEVAVQYSDSYLGETGWMRNTDAVVGILRLVFALLAVLYASWRYARRAIEKEAPHRRVLVLGGAVAVLSVVIFLTDSSIAITTLEAAAMSPGVQFVIYSSILAAFVAMGAAVGVGYGSGESEMREGFPGKMTSLDAFLLGRFFNRNVGVAVAAGISFACWCYCLLLAASYFTTAELPTVPEHAVGLTFAQTPLLLLPFSMVMASLYIAITGLLVPVAFLHRRLHENKAFLPLLVLLSVLGANLYEPADQGLEGFTAKAVVLTIALLGPFFAVDVLASWVSVLVFQGLSMLGDMAGIAPFWQERYWLLLGAALVAGAFPAAGAWFGRTVSDAEVRPAHAANLAERLALRAALSAAREAQLRLMPDATPQIPGLGIAASCTPAREVSGDFYDFIPLGGGRLAAVIGEGGNDGLASALTIALTKGYVLYATSKSEVETRSPSDLLKGLDRVLGRMLERESGKTSLAMVFVDPPGRQVQAARLGDWPQILLLRHGGTVVELGSSSDAKSGSAKVAPGDFLVIVTDGLAKLLEQGTGESPSEVLRRAAGFSGLDSARRLHDQFISAVRSGAAGRVQSDDLTAVVIGFEESAAGTMESVA